jgi:iron-sulfur cluster repair protein YtfE (RIC family)
VSGGAGADDLFVRAGVGDDVAPFRPEFPRPLWPGHRNLGETARFWLQRHAMFREFGAVLTDASAAFRDDPADPQGFRGWLFPRLQMYLSELHGHHHVEDQHYFPLFRAADARLGRGFDILDADHHAIDGLIHSVAQSANAFDAAIRGNGEVDRAGAALVAELAHMLAGIGRHLEDEEDIVVPTILARTERGLGIA